MAGRERIAYTQVAHQGLDSRLDVFQSTLCCLKGCHLQSLAYTGTNLGVHFQPTKEG